MRRQSVLSLGGFRRQCIWPSGFMLKVTGRVMPGASSFLPFTVSAANDAGNGEKEETSSVNLDELSLYTAPPPPLWYEESEAGQLEEKVATVRKLAEPYAIWCQSAYSKIKPKVQKVVQLGNDTYVNLQYPPKDFYPRAGVIGLAGVVGLFLARGSRIKKVLYPTGLMTLGASLYYPEQAAAIAKSAGDSVYDTAVQSYAAVEKILKSQVKDKKSNEK
ncbi:MICOS complex subunit MIC26-like [Poecilia latipinna]|uniref:MICOS complex subunit MIC26-like n=1 Tax=Poecilia latipinna TaxID=48699 RepID=UPI00072EC802|nr:PREDICTED: MICOS complex subunit MIC26-like [Poecilia latipinna]XP_014885375.1 PREDICTED: MICOS complex subunit MIC26-like [Poecilia latipinna]XP_014908619.1 PREDICTED: MICOS complex subunit MIC26-like [Poecilia latipinna]